jgi:hypothetical protein
LKTVRTIQRLIQNPALPRLCYRFAALKDG